MSHFLNEKITMAKKVTTVDAAGGYIEHWKELGRYWASVKFIREFSISNHDVERSGRIHSITMRYLIDVEKGMRINHEDKVYYVTKLNKQNKLYIAFEAVERV